MRNFIKAIISAFFKKIAKPSNNGVRRPYELNVCAHISERRMELFKNTLSKEIEELEQQGSNTQVENHIWKEGEDWEL